MNFAGKLRELLGGPRYEHYFANDLEHATNDIGLRRIIEARNAFKGRVGSPEMRRTYERDQFSALPGVHLDETRFEAIRNRAVSALTDREMSPCCFFQGKQAEAQGIPREVITHDVRRYTTDVGSAIPDAAELLSPELVAAMQSCIGSNFSLEDIFLTRNFHVDPAINSKYEILSDRWHFDHQYPDGFSLFVCLSSVTKDDGPFHVISAEDSRDLLTNKGFDASLRTKSPTGGIPVQAFEDKRSFTRLVGQPGTMLLCHTSYCLHRAGVPEPDHVRDMMIFTFRPSVDMDLRWPRPTS